MQVAYVVTADRERSAYNRIRGLKNFQKKVITEGFLRVEVALVQGQNNYSFFIAKNTGQRLMENKLDLNDAFVVTKLGTRLLVDDSAAPGTHALQTYPNNSEFAAAIVPGLTTPNHLEAFYNGKLQIKVGDTVFADAIDTNRFRYVGTAQQTSATTKSEQWEDSGLSYMTRQIILQGQSKNDITLTVPAFPTQTIQATSGTALTYVVLYCRGFLVTGGSNVGNLQDDSQD